MKPSRSVYCRNRSSSTLNPTRTGHLVLHRHREHPAAHAIDTVDLPLHVVGHGGEGEAEFVDGGFVHLEIDRGLVDAARAAPTAIATDGTCTGAGIARCRTADRDVVAFT